MNAYLLNQLAEARHQELVAEAREYRRMRAARPTARFLRRGTGRSAHRWSGA
jgi:hypothetical protein